MDGRSFFGRFFHLVIYLQMIVTYQPIRKRLSQALQKVKEQFICK